MCSMTVGAEWPGLFPADAAMSTLLASLPGGAVLASVIDGLDPATVDAEVLWEATAGLQRVRCWLEAADMAWCAALNARGGVPGEFRADDLALRAHISPTEAQRRLDRGEDLTNRVIPATHAALRAGQITAWHAHVIADALRDLPAGADRDAAEARLAIQAVSMNVPRTRLAAQAEAEALDPERAQNSHDAAHDQRCLLFRRRRDGDDYLYGQLAPEQMAIVKAAIDARAGKTGPEDTRRIATRRADALVELARRGATPDQPGAAPRRNPIGLLAPLATVLGQSDLPGRFADGAVVPAASVRRMCCDAPTTVLFTDHDGHLLDLGRTSRYPDTRLRAYLVIRDQTCQFPGCGILAGNCEIHHATYWDRGGGTDRVNCLCLCAHHHHLVHEGRWTLTRHPDQTTTWTGPDAVTRHVRPPLLPGARPRLPARHPPP
jgi:hypothetical protein